MPTTLPGKLAAAFLVVFLIQLLVFGTMLFNDNGFGAIVIFVQFAPFTALLGILFGSIGAIKERKGKRIFPLLSTATAGIFLAVSIYFLFIWSFGG